MRIWLAGIVLLVVPMVGNGALRGVGDTVSPTAVMLVAGAINGALDPCLIFGLGPFPRLELPGAAYATVISWAFTLVASLALLRRRDLLSWAAATGGKLLDSWAEVLVIGLPSVGTNLLVPASAAALTRLAAGFGPAVVAAFGVGSRVEALTLVGVMAVGSVNSIFTGQNWGAGKRDRVRRAAALTLRFAAIYGVLGWAALLTLRWPLAGAFADDSAEVTDAAAKYFLLVPIGYAGLGAAALSSGVFNALKRPASSVLIISVRLFALCVPLAWLGSAVGGLTGFFLGIAAGNLIAGAFAAALLWRSLDPSTDPDPAGRETAPEPTAELEAAPA